MVKPPVAMMSKSGRAGVVEIVTYRSRRERVVALARRAWRGVEGEGNRPWRRWFGRWRSRGGRE